MRILHTADWFVGRRLFGMDRSDELVGALAEVSQIASDSQVDLTVIAGGLFGGRSTSDKARQAVRTVLGELSETAPVAVIGGEPEMASGIHRIADSFEHGRVVVATPGLGGPVPETVEYDDLGAVLALIPSRATFFARPLRRRAPDNDEARKAALTDTVENLTNSMTKETVNVVVLRTERSAHPSAGLEGLAGVIAQSLPLSAFAPPLSYIALGNSLGPISVGKSTEAWFPGPPIQWAFDEPADMGVLVVEATPNRRANVSFVPVSAGKRLVTLRGSEEEVIAAAKVLDPERSLVRVHVAGERSDRVANAIYGSLPRALRVTFESDGLPVEAFGGYVEDRILFLMDDDDDESGGGAGVREPRRPRPSAPGVAATRDLPEL